MRKQHFSKAALSVLVTSMVVSGGTAWANTPSSPATIGGTEAYAGLTAAPKLRFPDVPTSHWALKHVSRLAQLGIVQGDDLGRYNPENPVTQEEVIIMVIRMLGLEEEALKIPVDSYVLSRPDAPFEVSDFAKHYIIMAIEKKIIDINGEIAIGGTVSGPWGKRQATREWVAKLSVSSIGKQGEAEKLKEKATAFTDNADISNWSRGYINAAADLQIVNGMEDGSFKPKDKVTRAQMAAFLSRAGQHAEPAEGKAMIGSVGDISSESITVIDKNNRSHTYLLSNDTYYYGLNNETTLASNSDIKLNNQVYLIYTGLGQATFVEVVKEVADPILGDTVEGELIEVQPALGTMTLVWNGREVEVGLLIPPVIKDKDGKGLALSELEDGMKVELNRKSGETVYSSVLVKEAPKTAVGLITSIDLNGKKLGATEEGAGSFEYQWSDQTTYTVNGAAGQLNSLRKGDTVRYKVKGGQIVTIEMVQPYAAPTDSGKLISSKADRELSYVTIQRADNKLAVYTLAASVQIQIPGLPYARLADILEGDVLKLTLDDEKTTVTHIEVTNRSISTTYFNSIVNYDAEGKILTVLNGNQVPVSYRLSDTTQLELDNSVMPITSATSFLSKGKKVNITSSKETNVLKVQVAYSYEGTVLRADPLRGEVVLKTGLDQTFSFRLVAGARVEIPGNSNAAVSDLIVGEKVKVTMTSGQDEVAGVYTHRSATYRVDSVNTVLKQLVLRNSAGTIVTVTLTNEPIVNTSGTAIAISELSADEPIQLEYVGNQVKKVISTPASRGKVTSIHSSSGEITFLDANGSTRTVTVGTDAKVRTQAGSTTSLSELKEGDRVEMYRDGSTYSIRVAQVLNKSFDHYKATERSVTVKRATLSEPLMSYVLHQKAYIHKGTQTLAPTQLVNGDSIVLYLIDNKVVEVEKL